MFDNYPIRILKNSKNNLRSRLNEIDNGLYDDSPKERIKKLRTSINHDLKEVEFAIEVLETYQD